MRATVISDASFSSEGIRHYAGWAAWVRVDGIDYPIKGAGVIKPHPQLIDSNAAEIFAALNGIWLARQHGGLNILVRSDNMAVGYVIERKIRSLRLSRIWQDALARDDMRGITLRFNHVRGHTKDPAAASWVNRWCDTEAGFFRLKQIHEAQSETRPNRRENRQGCPGAEGTRAL